MAALEPTMLWESVDATTALAQRFRFATSTEASHWLTATLLHEYAIEVTSITRLTISAYNLLAWLNTPQGPLLAKCCAIADAHPQLLALGALLVWLDEQDLPVSAPLRAKTGSMQVLCDHLSLGVQRLLPGDLLDPSQLHQAHCAGVVLAQMHQALSIFSHTMQAFGQSRASNLKNAINQWMGEKRKICIKPGLAAAIQSLTKQVDDLDETNGESQLVHNDFRAANILWHKEKISAVLDFEELSWGFRVNDLAWAAVHLGTRFHNWAPVPMEVHDVFVRGYQGQQILTGSEEAWLPPLLAWHTINLALSSSNEAVYTACLDSANAYLKLLPKR